MNYILIHKKYFYNILTSVCLLLVMFVSVIVFGIIILKYNPKSAYFFQDEVLNEIINSLLVYIKLVIVFWLSYVWGNFFVKDNNGYHLLINNYQKNRRAFLNTKIIILILYNLLVFGFLFLTSILLIKFNLPFLLDIKRIIILFMNCFGVSILYGLIGIIFVIIIPHNYAAIIPSFFYAFSQIIDGIEELKIFKKIYLLFFSNINDINGFVLSSYGIYHLLIICGVYYAIVIFLYNLVKK